MRAYLLEARTSQVPTSCMFHFTLLLKLFLTTRAAQTVGAFLWGGEGGWEIAWVASPRVASVLRNTTGLTGA